MSAEVSITPTTTSPIVPNGHQPTISNGVSKSNEVSVAQSSNPVVTVPASSSSTIVPTTSPPAPQLYPSPHPLAPNPLAAYQIPYPGAYPYQYPFFPPFPAPFPGAFPAVHYDPQTLAPLTSYLPSVMAHQLRPPFMSQTPVGPLFFGQSLAPTNEHFITSSANSTQPTSNSQTAIDSNGTGGTSAASLSAIKGRSGSSRGLLGSTPPGQKSGLRTNLTNGLSTSNSTSSPNKGNNYGGYNYGGFAKQPVGNHRTSEKANNYGGFASVCSASSSHNQVSQNASAASTLKITRPESAPNTKQDLPPLKEEEQTRLEQEKRELQESTNKSIESLDWKSPRNRYLIH